VGRPVNAKIPQKRPWQFGGVMSWWVNGGLSSEIPALLQVAPSPRGQNRGDFVGVGSYNSTSRFGVPNIGTRNPSPVGGGVPLAGNNEVWRPPPFLSRLGEPPENWTKTKGKIWKTKRIVVPIPHNKNLRRRSCKPFGCPKSNWRQKWFVMPFYVLPPWPGYGVF